MYWLRNSVWTFQIFKSRYHYGHTDRPIYAIGQKYFCAVKIGQKPAKHRSMDFDWEEYNSSFAKSIGWQIYFCKVD